MRDVSTYAFKALAFQLALREVAPAVLWLDCGLEVGGCGTFPLSTYLWGCAL